MFSNKETFGQYPLQVNGFSNIHESLEAAMSQEIETYDVMTKSGQEVKHGKPTLPDNCSFWLIESHQKS